MKTKQGISLIVLVITIIVMVVLAAAIIVSLDNAGILDRANEAVESTNIKQVQQLAALTWTEAYLDGKRGDELKEEVLESLKDYKDKYDIIISDSGVDVKDKTTSDTGWLPAGIKALDQKYFTFDFNTTTKKATITGFADDYLETSYYRETYYPIAIVDGDKRITDIVLPSTVLGEDGETYTVTAIGAQAFYTGDFSSPTTKSEFSSLIIPETIETIGEQAFVGWSKVTKVYIPNSIVSLGNFAFDILPTELHYKGNMDEWLEMAKMSTLSYSNQYDLYLAGKLIEEVILPSTLTKVEADMFGGCKSLKSITIPNSVTTIEQRAFEDCDNLSSVVLPNDVTIIDEYVFSGCDSLKSITIPDKVTEICRQAFYWCESLESITIPATVTTIGMSVFYGCESLTDVYYKGTEDEWYDNVSIETGNSELSTVMIHFEEGNSTE